MPEDTPPRGARGSDAPGAEPRSELEPPTAPAGPPGWPGDEAFARGLATRRAVLGDEHVERSLAGATSLDRDFQEHVTRAVWGDVWSRPGLSRHTRHLLTLALLAALDRQEELALHLRATARTGVTLEELREVLLQVSVYAGVPAANAALRTAKRVLGEGLDEERR